MVQSLEGGTFEDTIPAGIIAVDPTCSLWQLGGSRTKVAVQEPQFDE